MSAYARRFGWLNGRFFALPRGFRLEDARRVAARHPTFRLSATLLVAWSWRWGSSRRRGPPPRARATSSGRTRCRPTSRPPGRSCGAPSTGRPRARSPAPTSTTCSGSGAASCRAGPARRPAPHGGPHPARQRLVVRAPRRPGRARRSCATRTGSSSTYWEGRGFAVNPVATAGRWQGLNDGVTPEDLADALLPSTWPSSATAGGALPALGVLRRARPARGDPPGGLGDGAGAHRPADGPRLPPHRRAAASPTRARRRPGGLHGRRSTPAGCVSWSRWPAGVRPMPWYVERAYPGASPWKGAALNGFMVTLLNLRRHRAAAARAAPRAPPGNRSPSARRGAARTAVTARALARAGRRHPGPVPADCTTPGAGASTGC